MNAFSDAFLYLNDPFNWTGPRGILYLAGQHLQIAGLAMLIGLVVALPPAIWLGHRGRGGAFLLGLSNVSRAVPTLAILTIFAVTSIGFTIWAPVIALAVFAVPPVLANTYVGFREVDRDVVEAARAMGMSGRQVVFRAELPLALPLVMTGIRTAAVQVVATATLASLLGNPTLGTVIRSGFGRQDYGIVVAGALLVAALAMATDALLGTLSWAVTPGQKRVPFGRVRSRRAEAAGVATAR
ncbi:ABC transporter permease [Modestobacter versicolor]|uniref:ABC transporter permease n=2 Tax=Bacteria TaxID=2 RepID=A0A323V6N7_9ACTN|nr:ABC transporter permease [Modestobacter versicolor]MBB3676767.1 osmoprotectant transport system permease protein [Modestobacter versicolor]PZA20201.1 ABC transporter permease [Modestobacter versicolor]